MTDWWNTAPVRQEGDDGWQVQAREDMSRIARNGENLSAEPDDWSHEPQEDPAGSRQTPSAPEPEAQRPDRRKSLLLGAAGAAAVGVLVFTVMPHDGSTPEKSPSASVSSQEGGFLPPAGGGPTEGAKDRSESSVAPAPQVPKTVTLSTEAAGSGTVGVIVKLTIVNNTDEAVVVMSSMVKGDGRPAVIGEGTLAPSSRKIEPGETAVGTVEFTSKKAPSQIMLLDFSGNVVAANG